MIMYNKNNYSNCYYDYHPPLDYLPLPAVRSLLYFTPLKNVS